MAGLPPFTQKFVMKHETGHYVGKTNSEFFADNYAFQHLALTEPNSLKNSILALSEVLPMTTPEHDARLRAQTIRSLKTDILINKNPKALKVLAEFYPEELNNISSFDDSASIKPDYKMIGIVLIVLALVFAFIFITTQKHGFTS
jgi:hypothetical protein